MDELVNFIIGGATSPLEVAIRLFLFVILVDAIFGTINALVCGSKM